ncbi:MAG: hypothetical protein IJ558_04035 [Treponema sp.]|nr:hypothetical protein [Treponema sp.]
MIKSYYSESNDYAGYFNYMKYWARNGDYNWICDTSEWAGTYQDDIKVVAKTYKVKSFWDNFNGEQTPLDIRYGTSDVDGRGGSVAYGWKTKSE